MIKGSSGPVGSHHRNAVREQFRARSTSYNNYTVWASDERIAAEIARPLGHLRKNARCIDIGAGTGLLEEYLAGEAGKWVSVDVSEDMLRQRHHGYSLVGDGERLPLCAKAVDAAVARSVLAYVDPAGLIAETKRVLKDDGLLVIAEKVLGDYVGNAADWFREIQTLRNPLKSLPLQTHEIAAIVAAERLKLISSIEFRRTYTYQLDDWVSRMGTINSTAQKKIVELLRDAPTLAGEKSVTVDRDLVHIGLSWAVICGRREDRDTQAARLIATVVPVRLKSDQVEIYMQKRLEPVYREPEYIGMLEFPQGHVETSETIREAAARELREEAGMEIKRIVWDTEERKSGVEGNVSWDGFERVGLVRTRGRLDYVAAWLIAEVRDSVSQGSLDNSGRWLTLTEAITADHRGTVYPLNAPMVRALAAAECDIGGVLRSEL